MKKSYLLLWLISLFLFSLNSLFAQSDTLVISEADEVRYGDIDPQWVRANYVPSSPNADAVILSDIGWGVLPPTSSRTYMVYRYLRRVKVLTEEGKKYAEVVIPYNPLVNSISDLRASTYKINSEDELVAFKVDNKTIEDIRLAKDRREIRFRLPLVDKGVIFEYGYTVVSERINLLRPWYFQYDIPVLHSEFHLQVPAMYVFQMVPQGDVRTMRVLSETADFGPSGLGPIFRMAIPGGQTDKDKELQLSGTHRVFVMRKIAPRADERFAPRDELLRPGIRFQLVDVVSRVNPEGLFSKWDNLNRYMGRRLRKRKLKIEEKTLARQTKPLIRSLNSDVEKAQAIYSWVKKTYQWDSTYTLTPTKLQEVQRTRIGSGAAINMLMLHMMQDARLDVAPVLISTRDHGPIQVVAPNLAQFNHVIVRLKIRGKDMLMDATGDVESIGVLPKRDLNQAGFVVLPDGGDWIYLQTRNQLIRYTYSRFTLNDKGVMTGDISLTSRDYSAAQERERLGKLEGDEQQYIRQYLLTGMQQAEILDYSIENASKPQIPLVVNCGLQTRDFVEQVDELLFIKPLMTKMVSENPFPDSDRQVPVDLTYPLREAHLLGLRIPKGYEVAQLPQPIRVELPNDAGAFTFNVLNFNDIIHVSSSIFLNKTIFLPDEYEGIRVFFEYVVQKHAEDIVLKKVEEEG